MGVGEKVVGEKVSMRVGVRVRSCRGRGQGVGGKGDERSDEGALYAMAVVTHRGEGQGVRQMQTHHDHPRHPEEQDVEPGLEQLGGVEGLQVVRVVGPTEDREREEARAEPGIEHVFVLVEGELVALHAELLGGSRLRHTGDREGE